MTTFQIEKDIVKLLNDYFFLYSRATPESYEQQQKRIENVCEQAEDEFNMDRNGTKLIFQTILSVANTNKHLHTLENKVNYN